MRCLLFNKKGMSLVRTQVQSNKIKIKKKKNLYIFNKKLIDYQKVMVL